MDIGLAATPMLYFAVGKLGERAENPAGGVMVTASHNTAEYNGFKLCRAGAAPISGESGLKEIEELSNQQAGTDTTPQKLDKAALESFPNLHAAKTGAALPEGCNQHCGTLTTPTSRR